MCIEVSFVVLQYYDRAWCVINVLKIILMKPSLFRYCDVFRKMIRELEAPASL